MKLLLLYRVKYPRRAFGVGGYPNGSEAFKFDRYVIR